MYRSNEGEIGYKHGEFGPSYLSRGPRIDTGIIRLRPGDEYRNHVHLRSENTFITIEGEAVLWSDCRERFVLRPGDLHRCDPGEMHFLVNEGLVPWRAVFIRSPYDPADTVDVPWRPGESPPERPTR